MDIKPRIGVCLDHPDSVQSAFLRKLAETLAFECFTGTPGKYCFTLNFVEDRLGLFNIRDPGTKPLFVDFLSGPCYYRFVNDRRINQPLAKAVGIKAGHRPRVLDATAGFGEDAFVLASLGCSVTMIERSPVIWALLDDGFRRAAENKSVGRVIKNKLQLIRGDSLEYIKRAGPAFETIYLDPIFPPRSGSALNKKRMRLLKELVGSDPDAAQLLNEALVHAGKRVSVKRPLRAEPLGGLDPTFSISAKSSRYDVYMT